MSAALAACVIGAMVAVTVPVAIQAAGAQPTVSCTFNGKAGPTALTGVVPGTSSVAIVCTGTSGLGVASIMASPLGGIVIPPATPTKEADISTLTPLTESPAGTYKATFAVPATFSASDPNAVCPPSAGQFNAGVIGCALAVINTASLSQFPGQEAILLTTTQTHAPNSPTLATGSNEVTAGEPITFTDATGACTDNPTASSQCWWGDALRTSSTAANPATLTVSLDGTPVPGATATVSGPGTGGTGTYNGTTLVPQTLSGSLTLPSPLSDGTHTLTVTQTNVTPFDGNGGSPKAGSPISASTTLVVGAVSGPIVTGVSPSSGTSAGGTAVTVTGTNLAGATAVHFGTRAAHFTVVSSTSITANSPAGVGAVDVTVTTPSGTSLRSNADRFIYASPTAPVVTGIIPSSGTQEGGTLVIVSGSGFTRTKAVHFGTIAASSFHVDSDSQLVAVSPSGSGTVNVTVTTRLGTSEATTADEYSYLPGSAAAPSVTAVNPAVGIGGTVVTVSGTGLSGASAVDFGSTAATHVTVDSDSSITATAPSGSVTGNAVDVTVTTPAGTSATGSADQFTYVGGPVISSVSPNVGSPLGGYSVTVNGSGFTGASEVDFGTTASPSISVGADSSVTATVPAGTGTVDVRVTTPAGTSAKSSDDLFTYGVAVVATLSPNAGSPLGGYTVTIGGTGFTGASAVDFGSTAATNVVVSSEDSLTATAPAGTGTVDVRVTNPAGISAISSADQFMYAAVPTVSAVSPNQGPTAGGNLVTVNGTSLTGASVVDFGSTAGTDITVISDTTLTVIAAAGTGIVHVTVTVPSDTSLKSSADQYTYDPVPTVTHLSPTSGPSSGGTTVAITGAGFTSATEVNFGAGNSAGSPTINSDTSITITAPASPSGAGPVNVTVVNPGGTSVTSSADVFTYVALPAVSSVSPAFGPLAGGTQVEVTGTGFTASSTVDFATNAATDVFVASSGVIFATSPAGTSTVDVTVTTASGTSVTSGADQFTYQGGPTVTSVSPNSGPVGGNVSVTITGTNFGGASAVRFGSVASSSISVTPTSITATAPSTVSPGAVHVTVVTQSGTSATASDDLFTYVAVPTITAISPPSGPVSGGTTVTITGTAFSHPSSVTFGLIPASHVAVVSSTKITATAPGQITQAPFGVTVQVTTAGGTAGDGSAADTFNYTPVVPTVTSVSPNRNTTAGDSLVTITGTGFTSDATVNFGSAGGALEGDVIVNSSTSLTANSPAASPGTVDITVTTSGGTSAVASADAFTYVTETATLQISPTTGNSSGGTVTVTGSGFPTGNWSIDESGVLLLQADPMAAFLHGISAIEEIDLNDLGEPTVDDSGNFTTTFTLANPFTPLGDANGTCPPLQNEVDMGLVGCAIAAVNLNATTFLGTLGDVPVIYSGTQPDPPTLAVPSTVVHVRDGLSFSGTGWWGSYPGGGATAKICGLGGNPATCDATTGSGVVAPVTYSGTNSGAGGTLSGATVSGSITVAPDLANCTTCFLTVTQPNLTPIPGTVTASLALTILPALPAVTSVSPDTGPTKGGTTVTIRGRGFRGVTAVDFGTRRASSFTVVSGTEITAKLPRHARGIVDVTLSNAGGRSVTSERDGFTYRAAPMVTSVSPDSGPATGGTKVTIRGTGFTGATAVHFGTTPATSFAVDSSTKITAVTPKHRARIVGVTVTTGAGASALSERDTFRYKT